MVKWWTHAILRAASAQPLTRQSQQAFRTVSGWFWQDKDLHLYGTFLLQAVGGGYLSR
jgi:hypothetical protein